MKTGGSKFCARRRVYSAFFGGRTVAIFVRSDGLWSCLFSNGRGRGWRCWTRVGLLQYSAGNVKLRTLLPLFQDHPELITLLGQKARRVLERYTLSRNITQLEQLYTQVLEQRRVRVGC